ncbi:hypothetical protein GQ600_16518 [Phytophthora cactorum]|nr:hypothetical protein GQ600_16518 [Phytophthora cactorum]
MTQPRQASCSLSAAAWRTIAEQQLEALQLAELLQKRLKLAVESRSRLIREMHQRLGSKESLSKHVNLNKHKRVQLGSSDVDIFETYLREIDAVYVQTDRVFQTLPVESASRNPDSNWLFDAATGFFTFADRRNIPFDFKLASQICGNLRTLSSAKKIGSSTNVRKTRATLSRSNFALQDICIVADLCRWFRVWLDGATVRRTAWW